MATLSAANSLARESWSRDLAFRRNGLSRRTYRPISFGAAHGVEITFPLILAVGLGNSPVALLHIDEEFRASSTACFFVLARSASSPLRPARRRCLCWCALHVSGSIEVSTGSISHDASHRDRLPIRSCHKVPGWLSGLAVFEQAVPARIDRVLLRAGASGRHGLGHELRVDVDRGAHIRLDVYDKPSIYTFAARAFNAPCLRGACRPLTARHAHHQRSFAPHRRTPSARPRLGDLADRVEGRARRPQRHRQDHAVQRHHRRDRRPRPARSACRRTCASARSRRKRRAPRSR